MTLSVFCLEAVLNRIRNVRGDTVDKNDKANYLNNKQYIELLVKDPKLGDIADELFAIRDAIAHNHLWSAQISWNKSGDLQFVGEPQLTAGYGNERFRKVTNLNTRKTNKLDLNVFPNRIWRRDAYIVFKNVYLLLKAFEETNRNYIYFSHMPYLFMDEMISIEEIAARIQVPSE